MNIKNICKILGTTTVMMGVLVLAGAINSTPAQATEKILQADSEVTTSSGVSLNEKINNNYKIDVNASVEKQGFKFTIKNVTATRHNMNVVASLESSKLSSYDRESLYENMLQMAVRNGMSESYGYSDKKIDDNTIEYTFNITSSEGFNDVVKLRFDAIVPKYDINAWVEADVDISKYLDKSIKKAVQFNFGDNEFYRLESDILGTSIYYKEKERDYHSSSDEDRTWDSESQLLLKYNDKLYEMEDGGSYMSDDDSIEGYYRTNILKVDDLDSKDNISIVPIKCNIKSSEIDSIIDRERDKEDYSEENNVKYNKEFKFADNSKGIISKIERNDDKVKVYFSSDSDKDSILMGVAMRGYYDYTEEDSSLFDNYEDIEKIIYKNPNEENGYIAEFNNVAKNKKFIIHCSDVVLAQNDKFDISDEIKIK